MNLKFKAALQEEDKIFSLNNRVKKETKNSNYNIRLIRSEDNSKIKTLIKKIRTEFNADTKEYKDIALDNMFEHYSKRNNRYLIIEKDQKILGGIGLAPLKGGDKNICELQKFYLLKKVRGIGLGKKLMEQILIKAQQLNYKFCYIETINNMTNAISLYYKYGFKKLEKPIGDTGCFIANVWLLKNL